MCRSSCQPFASFGPDMVRKGCAAVPFSASCLHFSSSVSQKHKEGENVDERGIGGMLEVTDSLLASALCRAF